MNVTGVTREVSIETKDRKLLEQEWRRKQLRRVISIVTGSPLTITGFCIVSGLVVIAILAPFIAPYDPLAINLREELKPPSLVHPFGTDDLGRDVFSRILYGTEISLRVGTVALLFILGIGIPLGAISGYFGGKIDTLIMRLGDVFLAFPNLVLALAISAALGGGIQNVMIAVAAPAWPWYARLVRGVTLSAKEEEYIQAAHALGQSPLRIIFKHILPNCIGPIIVQASQSMGFTILTAASLGFIGIGAQPPSPEWGLMVSTGRIHFMDEWWVATFPGLAILITVLGFSLMGDGLRDILDPTMRE
ncbi:MAG: ABC transporter permease [Candidatus Tectomicrobia bacterium]|nr:ABC transporter permease [Candidatus Tectomicrobia bacterium]